MIIKYLTNRIVALLFHYPMMRNYYKKKELFINSCNSSSELTNTKERECVVFMADGLIKQGGLADRLRGIVSLFQFCKENNLVFTINFLVPFNLQEFLKPNFYDWTISPTEISYSSSKHKVVVLIPEKSVGHWPDRKFQKNQLFVKLCRNNMQYHVYTNVNLVGLEFGSLFKELFLPTEKLQLYLDEHLEIIGNEYISLSYRFLNILGDFKDTIEYDLSEKERTNILMKCVDSICEMINKYPKINRILVTSDSQTFLSKIKDIPKVYVVEGAISHVDDSTAEEGHLKTFIDFYLISNAKKVFLMRTKEMYRSSFARTASLINSVPFEEVEL